MERCKTGNKLSLAAFVTSRSDDTMHEPRRCFRSQWLSRAGRKKSASFVGPFIPMFLLFSFFFLFHFQRSTFQEISLAIIVNYIPVLIAQRVIRLASLMNLIMLVDLFFPRSCIALTMVNGCLVVSQPNLHLAW